MKIFIVGKYNTFFNELIKKFDKENDKVYVLTGEKYRGPKPHRVFEQYVFPYSGDSIIEVLDSVQPDVLLFTGAYDANFQWQNLRSESMHYISGLINLIMSAESHKIKRFVYLSSEAVYQSHYETAIPADTPTSAVDYRSIAITQGEDLCRHFNLTTELDISVLRLEHIYKFPENPEEIDDPCTDLCLEAITTGAVTVNENLVFSMLHIDDAVHAVYQFIHTPEHKEFLYQVSSGEPVTQLQLAEAIKEKDSGLSIRDNTQGTKQQVILDSTAFNEEFQFRIFHSYKKEVPAIYQKMLKHKKNYQVKKTAKSMNAFTARVKAFFTALVPFLENIILFIPVFMINNRTTGSQYFERLDFFLLYVLLFAGVYGTKQAIFSASLSVVGYCFRQLYSRSGFDLLIDYNTYLWIAQLFIVAMAVGRLRDSTKAITFEKDEEISFLNSQLEDLININDSNNRIKNIYQNRIIDYDDSLVKIYSITSELDKLEAGAVLFYAADIIGRILGTKDVAIYQIANADYCRLFSATSNQAKSLGKSVKYSDMTDIVTAINNRQVYINKTMDEEYPLLASAIYRSEQPIEIIMLWGLPFEKMTLYQCNLLTVLGYMIYNSVERADRYLDALATTRFIPNTKLLTRDAFEELRATYQDAMDKGFTEFTILTVSADHEMTYLDWSNTLSSRLRLSDYLGVDKNGRVCILLTNSNINDAQFIIQRFGQMGVTCTPV
ncbi:MAG: NAD(P)-dependent oxidoreductase [Clostridiaceae bacterium]|nr:NAD(P)-dependent oxidoreductase [Clostridiaceae bacterium]